MALQVLTYPFCGSCGWDFRENKNDDVFCDACGADLRLFVDPGQIAPEDLVATPNVADVTFTWTANPSADSTESRTIQTSAPTWTAWAPDTSPTIVVAAAGETVCIEVRSIVAGTPGPAAQECATVAAAPADGATAGTPGIFTPPGADIPADFAGMSVITANPLTGWGAGTWVEPADASETYWDGFAWVVGQSVGPATGATAGIPGSFTPAGANLPADLADLIAIAPVASPLTLWTVGQSVVLGDASDAHWNGTAYVTGVAPA